MNNNRLEEKRNGGKKERAAILHKKSGDPGFNKILIICPSKFTHNIRFSYLPCSHYKQCFFILLLLPFK